MMVRDELAVIDRALESVRGLVDLWHVVDTGSTDGSGSRARAVLDVPGVTHVHEWADFGTNRTAALACAGRSAEWLLMLDADMTVEYHGGLRAWLEGVDSELDGFYVDVDDHGLHYRLPLLVRSSLVWQYVGRTHEYLETAGRSIAPLRGLVVTHHGDGAGRDGKLERDLELLEAGVAAGEPRATFYAAETLRYLGRTDEARAMYARRARMHDGFEEERWYAAFQSAALEGSIGHLIVAWSQRPWRHEPLTAAARIAARDPRCATDLLFLEPL